MNGDVVDVVHIPLEAGKTVQHGLYIHIQYIQSGAGEDLRMPVGPA
jgi:hypothetical protein